MPALYRVTAKTTIAVIMSSHKAVRRRAQPNEASWGVCGWTSSEVSVTVC